MINIALHTLKRLQVPFTSYTEERVTANCPFAYWNHSGGTDNHPSFSFYYKDNRIGYKCWACGAQGGLLDFITVYGTYTKKNYVDVSQEITLALLTNGVFISRNHQLEEEFPVPIPEDNNKKYCPVNDVLECSLYLESRGVTERTVDILGLVCDPMERRVLFPIRGYDQNLYGYSGRDYSGRNTKIKVRDYNFKKKFFILGEDKWIHDFPIILVEGLFGFAHLFDIGVDRYANIGAVLGASSLTKHKADFINSEFYGHQVYLLYDNDKGGDMGLFGDDGKSGAVSKLQYNCRVYVPSWPKHPGKETYKSDPDELTLQEVEDILENTQLYM